MTTAWRDSRTATERARHLTLPRVCLVEAPGTLERRAVALVQQRGQGDCSHSVRCLTDRCRRADTFWTKVTAPLLGSRAGVQRAPSAWPPTRPDHHESQRRLGRVFLPESCDLNGPRTYIRRVPHRWCDFQGWGRGVDDLANHVVGRLKLDDLGKNHLKGPACVVKHVAGLVADSFCWRTRDLEALLEPVVEEPARPGCPGKSHSA